MTYLEAKNYLDSFARFGMRFGLSRTRRLLEALGDPQHDYRIMHVAGTNGKGSTCAFAASILQAAGHKVGLYTSPHLVKVNERIQVNGVHISDRHFAEGINAIRQLLPNMGSAEGAPTYFEICTILALWHFSKQQVDVVVLETGLGGRLDATNAVEPHVSVITRIGVDHVAQLGDSITSIANEKAGIIKPGTRIVIARQPADALGVLIAAAHHVGESAFVAGQDFILKQPTIKTESNRIDKPVDAQLASSLRPQNLSFRSKQASVDNIELALLGDHQIENAEAAIQATLLLDSLIRPENIHKGLQTTRWPGRFEIVSQEPTIILDGAHNPDGSKALSQAVRSLYGDHRVHLVFGVLADKDVINIAKNLLPVASQIYLTSARTDRALDMQSLKKLVASLGFEHQSFASVPEAINQASRDAMAAGKKTIVLAAGSLFVVGEAREYLLCEKK